MKRIINPQSTAISQFVGTDNTFVNASKTRTCAGVSPSTPSSVNLFTNAGIAPAFPIALRHSLLFDMAINASTAQHHCRMSDMTNIAISGITAPEYSPTT
jgi:hypothetical protein